MVLLQGKRRGRLEKLQLAVVVPLPKNKIKKNMEMNSSTLCKEGGETAPSFRRGWKKEKRGGVISLLLTGKKENMITEHLGAPIY